jgi:putative ABC transport system permease protein
MAVDWLTRVRGELPVVTGDLARDREIQQELADHLGDREGELRAAAVPADDVERIVARELMLAARARRRLGRRQMHLLADLLQDVRYSARLLVRTPGFFVAAAATLALSIGATTALFSVVHGVLLRPLPYPQPDRLVRLWESSPQGQVRNPVAAANYFDWTARATSFSSLGAMTQISDRALTGSGEPTKIEALSMTAGALEALGVSPLHGRAFSDADMAPNAASVAVLTHGFWQRRFGGSLSAIGQTVTLDDRPYEVIAIMPPGFGFPSPDVDVITNLWFSAEQRDERRSHNFHVIGRLRPGVSVAAADAELDAITSALASEHPQFLAGWSTHVTGMHQDAVREVKPLLSVLQGVVVAVLLIACANLANLQLARAERRMREMAVRAAIGAGRGRMVRQMLTEALLLALVGGVAGVAIAIVSTRAIVAAAPADIPFMERVAVDTAVLLAAAAATFACALAIGLAPALRVGRTDVRGLLHGGRVHGDRHQRRVRQALVVAQVAVAVVLVVSAVLLVRTFSRLSAVSPGYDPHGVLTVSIDLPRARYAELEAQRQFYERLFERLNAHPSIAAAAGTTAVPGEGASMTFSFAIEGRPSTNASGREHPVPLQGITPGYFDVMRIPVLGGRAFAASDRQDAPPVVIINEALARRHWPNGGAIGSRINFRPGHLPWTEIIGVVGSTRDEGLATPPPPTIYVPYAQRAATWGWMTWQTLVVRGNTDDALALVGDVKGTVWSIDPNLPLLETATVEQRLAEREARRHLAMALLTAFAGLALVLSTIGVYGVLSYVVAEQRQEIGIRLALGATPPAIARRIVLNGVTLAAAGVVLGMAGAYLVTRYLGTLLYEIEATDPFSFASTVGLLLVIAGAAAWVPARRAMRVHPSEVLRES